MKISVLCSNPGHPVMPFLMEWCKSRELKKQEVNLIHDIDQLTNGDILFLISCTQILPADIRARFKNVLVLHASDLPKKRGWSPYIWSILEGDSEITVTLLEAADKVDSGEIWLKKRFKLQGHELADEINELLFKAEVELMTEAIERYSEIKPYAQATLLNDDYCRKRLPEDSRLDPNKTIKEQFNLLRVADSERYPCFFDMNGHRYVISIKKAN